MTGSVERFSPELAARVSAELDALRFGTKRVCPKCGQYHGCETWRCPRSPQQIAEELLKGLRK